MKYQVLLFWGVIFIVTMPILLSYVTKYRLEKEQREKWEEHDKKLEKTAQEIDLKLRLKY